MCEKALDKIIDDMITKQLTNRNIANKGWVKAEIMDHNPTKSLEREFSVMKYQIKRLFCEVEHLKHEIEQLKDKPPKQNPFFGNNDTKFKHKLPRVGQLCYVWDDNKNKKTGRRFNKFTEGVGLFTDDYGTYWYHWSFIPVEDIQ